MVVYTLQANMTRGEVTPYVHARVDTEHYQAGLSIAHNFIVMRYGGVVRCPGTLYQGPLKSFTKKARTLRFEFNREQVYAIEAGDAYFRFWTADGRIESPPGTPVEVATPYPEAALKFIKTRQLGDVIYVYCKGYQPRTLTRTSETVWTLALHETKDGPYLPVDTQGVTLQLSSYGAINPLMTSNVLPSGTVSSSTASATAFRAFDFDRTTYANILSPTNGYVDYTPPTAKVANAYWIQVLWAFLETAPVSWTFEGYNGSSWVVLDTRTNQTGWTAMETRFYEFDNPTAYDAYRFRWDAVADTTGAGCNIVGLGIAESGDTMTPFNVVASAVTGINGGVGFVASDVGRAIRIFGPDGKWRWLKITARVNATTVTVRMYGHALPTLSPVAIWQLGAWSEETGWPQAVGIYEDRLISANTDTDPLSVWGSVNADYDNHRVSSPVVSDDAIAARLTGGVLNSISWLADSKDIVAGTAGSIRAVGRNNPNSAFGPDNIRQKTENITPSSTADPILIENVLMFLDLYEQRLYETAYAQEVEGYLAREASTLSEHLFALGVTKIVYMSSPHKIIFGLRTDGKLIAFTYDREQKVAGATLVDVGGAPNVGGGLPDLDIVEDIEVLPGENGTDLWLTMRRTFGASIVRYYERLAPFWRSLTNSAEAPVFAVCAIERPFAALSYNSTTGVLTISGLSHLNNATVGVLAGGRDLGDGVVSGGSVSVVSGIAPDAEVTAVVGKRMPALLETLRLSQIGNQDGSGLGRQVQIVEAAVDLFETAGLEIGSASGVELLTFEDDVEHDPTEPVELRTGMYSLNPDDSWVNNGVFVLATDSMYPATIRAISLGIDGEP